MGIPFNEIPEGLLVPGHYQEVDMSLAGGGSDKKIVLLIGQMLSTGVAVEGKEYPLTSAVDARALFGEGCGADHHRRCFHRTEYGGRDPRHRNQG